MVRRMDQFSDLIGIRKTKSSSSSSSSSSLSQDFQGYELLLLKRLQTDKQVSLEWRTKLVNKVRDNDYDIGEISHNLWYLTVTLDKKRDRFLNFVRSELQKSEEKASLLHRETLLGRYLNSHLFTELHLDGIFKYGDDNNLPKELFKCPSVKWLSLKYNYLDKIPPDIGRMHNLEYLALTNNKLQNKSIPYTLTFCAKLRTLMLDNNLLDALPGFLLKMASLDTVHRHGNHNYFKSTFMWYHTDVNERILEINGSGTDRSQKEPETLQFWAAKAVISLKINFYTDDSVTPGLKDYISDIYTRFNVCGFCNKTRLASESGFKVITFKNPYLGNTCVPFQHWACSYPCATNIEIPAREEQIAAARELDRQYDAYIRECQKQCNMSYSSASSSTMSIRLSNSSSRSHVANQSADTTACAWRERSHKHCCVS